MRKFLYSGAVLAAVLAGANAEDMPLVENAMQLLARASSTSEVLTLNLTNIAWYFKGGGLGTKLNETTARKVEMSLSIIK